MIKINGKKPPRKATINCGDNILSERLTTDGTTGTGYIGIEINPSSQNLVPVVWISEGVAGKPIKAMFGPEGKRQNAAKAKGAGGKISLTTGRKTMQAQVKLEHGKVYWLCHELKAKRGGAEPTASSSFIRSVSIGGGV